MPELLQLADAWLRLPDRRSFTARRVFQRLEAGEITPGEAAQLFQQNKVETQPAATAESIPASQPPIANAALFIRPTVEASKA